jgi:hypothetical protein
MSESPDSEVDSKAEATKPNRLGRALTWIGIVAGTVFILGAIFVAGAATSWHNHHQQQAISMLQKSEPPPADPASGDKCCCKKMAKK